MELKDPYLSVHIYFIFLLINKRKNIKENQFCALISWVDVNGIE